MLYCGIDNGIDGALCFMDENKNIIKLIPMPVIKFAIGKSQRRKLDIIAIANLLHEMKPNFICLEETFHMPGMYSGANFAMGYVLAVMETLFTAYHYNYYIVRAQVWQKHIFEGMDYKKRTKECSVEYAKSKFPNQTFLATKRASVPHNGLTDATNIALYGIWYNTVEANENDK